MRTESPEDRLLRLIKGKHKKAAAETAKAVPVEKKSFLTEVTRKLFLNNRAFNQSFFTVVGRILIAILVIGTIYLANNFLFNPYEDISSTIREREFSSIGEGTAEPAEPVSPQVTDYTAYLKEISGKELFSAPVEKKEEEKAPEIDVSKRFNLVGVISGDEPQAIIEDKDSKKTHYLYEGQSFSGVKVKEIGEGRVVLDYNGEDIILVL